MRRNVRVVPVLIHGTRMPIPADVPPSLAPLLTRNAIELTRKYWELDVQELVAALERFAGAAAARQTAVGPGPGEELSASEPTTTVAAAPETAAPETAEAEDAEPETAEPELAASGPEDDAARPAPEAAVPQPEDVRPQSEEVRPQPKAAKPEEAEPEALGSEPVASERRSAVGRSSWLHGRVPLAVGGGAAMLVVIALVAILSSGGTPAGRSSRPPAASETTSRSTGSTSAAATSELVQRIALSGQPAPERAVLRRWFEPRTATRSGSEPAGLDSLQRT